jgi:hypothetical protein
MSDMWQATCFTGCELGLLASALCGFSPAGGQSDLLYTEVAGCHRAERKDNAQGRHPHFSSLFLNVFTNTHGPKQASWPSSKSRSRGKEVTS